MQRGGGRTARAFCYPRRNRHARRRGRRILRGKIIDESSGSWAGAAWFTLAIINAGLAETKARSRLRWFVVSLFIGPLATALIVVWPRSTAQPQPPLRPFTSLKDRFLLLATSAMVVVVLGAVMAVFGGLAGADERFVLITAVIAALAAVAFIYTVRGYNRHALSRPARDS